MCINTDSENIISQVALNSVYRVDAVSNETRGLKFYCQIVVNKSALDNDNKEVSGVVEQDQS